MCNHLLRATSCCVALLSLQCSCGTSPTAAHTAPTPVVHFILPAGFNGPFVIAARDKHAPGALGPSSCREFRIPRDGVLLVQDDSVLYTWHTLMVSTGDGTIFRESPDLVTGRLNKSTLIFLEKDSAQGGKWRKNFFYFGEPARQDDVEQLNRIDSSLEAKCRSALKTSQ